MNTRTGTGTKNENGRKVIDDVTAILRNAPVYA